jgi:putative DNA primase/helicase
MPKHSMQILRQPTNAETAQYRLLKYLRRYTKRGLALLPIQPPVHGNMTTGKAPLTRHGHKNAAHGKKAVSKLFAECGNSNVAVATGSRSNIIVIDVDRPHGKKTLRNLEEKLGALPNTWQAKTGSGGTHYFFEWPTDCTFTRDTAGKVLGPNVDILGEGSYAVLPPSKHHSGKTYRWVAGHGTGSTLAKLPSAWLKRITDPRAPDMAVAPLATAAVQKVPVSEGARNDTLFRLASSWRGQGNSVAEIRNNLARANASCCKPPLDNAELDRIAASVSAFSTDLGKVDIPTLVAKACLAKHYRDGRHLIAHQGHFHAYTGTAWRPLGDDQLKKAILATIEEVIPGQKVRTANVMTEVVMILRAKQAGGEDPFHEITAPPRMINLVNGELHLRSSGKLRLKRHSPDSGQRHTLPVIYDPEATCPLYDRTLAEIFSKAKDPEGLVRHWHELFGYIIQPTRLHPVILVMTGGGSNGKTKLVETIMKLIGSDAAYCGVIQDLETNRFAIGALRGKLLFVDDDVKTRVRLPDGTLKKISEGKRLTGEEKFKNAATFDARAVPVLLCNHVPFLQDVSHGMQRRLHILPFEKRFEGEEKDDTLFPRIWKEELPGILNHALAGWQRLQSRGDFECPRDVLRTRKKWLKEANPFTAFLDEACEPTPDGRITLAAIYSKFIDWAKASGINRPLTRPQLKHDLQHTGFVVKKSNGEMIVRGLQLKQ